MSNKLSLMVNFVGVDKMSGALKNIVGLGKKGSQSLRSLAGEARRLQGEIRDYDRLMARTSGNVNALWDSQKRKMQELEQVQSRIARQQRLMAIEADKQAMLNRASDLKSSGQQNIVGGAAMAAPLFLAVKAGADFSSIMVDIQQKAELSDKATDRLRGNILASASAAKLLPMEMASAVDTLSGLGLLPQQAVKAAEPMGRFMTAFKVEGTDAAASVYAGFANLNIPLSRTGKLLDMMAAGGNQGAFEARDMATALPGLTAQMKGLGQTGEKSAAELIAMLEVVRRGTGDSMSAATNAQNLLAKLTAPTTTRAFKKNFGIDLPAAIKAGAAKGITPLQTVIEMTKKATGGDLSKLGYAFEDMQAQSAIRQLMLDYKDFINMRAEIAGSAGTVDKAFDQRVANDQTVQIKELTGAISEMVLTASPLLIPFLKQSTSLLKSGVTAITSFAKAHPAAAGLMMKLYAAAAVGKIAIGGLQFAFGSILGPGAKLFAFLRKNTPVFGMLRTAVIFLAKGFLRAGLMMMANPIVLLITAIVVAVGAAAYLIYTHWDKIKAAFWGGVSWVKETLAGLPDWLKSIGKLMISGLLSSINPMALAWRLIKVAKNGILSIMKVLDINSPSRVFMALGNHVTSGLERGIDRGRDGPARATRRMAAGVMAAGAMTLSPVGASGRPAQGAPASAAATGPITIHVHASPGMDVKDLAREVRRELENAQARHGRSSYSDNP